MTEPVHNTNASKVLSAAMSVESMVLELGEIVVKMREHPGDIDGAYRELYDFRTRLGVQIAKLGFGKPPRRRTYDVETL